MIAAQQRPTAAAQPGRRAAAAAAVAPAAAAVQPARRQQRALRLGSSNGGSTAALRRPALQQQASRSRPQVVVAAAAAAATPAAAAANAFWPALIQAWNTNPAAVMMGAGAAILGVALSVFLLASIPTMLALRRSAHAMEALLHTVRAEVPDTAATLRLSGLELADCISEVGALGTDLTEGVRASARALSSAEQGVRQAGFAAGKAMRETVLPQAQDKVEAALQERAKLRYTAQVVAEAAHSTRTVVQRLRLALAAGGVARGVATGLSLVGRRDGGSNGTGGGLRDDYY